MCTAPLPSATPAIVKAMAASELLESGSFSTRALPRPVNSRTNAP